MSKWMAKFMPWVKARQTHAAAMIELIRKGSASQNEIQGLLSLYCEGAGLDEKKAAHFTSKGGECLVRAAWESNNMGAFMWVLKNSNAETLTIAGSATVYSSDRGTPQPALALFARAAVGELHAHFGELSDFADDAAEEMVKAWPEGKLFPRETLERALMHRGKKFAKALLARVEESMLGKAIAPGNDAQKAKGPRL